MAILGRLHLLALEGGRDTILLNGDPVFGAALSPDGKQLAFLRPEFGRSGGWLYVARPDGGGLRLLSTLSESWYMLFPAWSPDGRWVAVQVMDTKNWLEPNRTVLIRPDTCEAVLLPGVASKITDWAE